MRNAHQIAETPPFYAECLRESLRGLRQSPLKYHQLEHFQLIWIKEGKGTFMVDLEKRLISDNTLYCLFPGQIHRFAPENELTGYKITFSEKFFLSESVTSNLPEALNYQEAGKYRQVMQLTSEMQLEIEDIVTMMIWEYNNQQRLRTDMIHALLRAMVAYFSRRIDVDNKAKSPCNDQIIFSRFMSILNQNFRRQKQVSDYASDLAVSSNYLSEVVKRATGNSAIYHIKQRVLLEAKRMAITSGKSMKEIAMDLGFEDPSTFSKFFKIQTGVTYTGFLRSVLVDN